MLGEIFDSFFQLLCGLITLFISEADETSAFFAVSLATINSRSLSFFFKSSTSLVNDAFASFRVLIISYCSWHIFIISLEMALISSHSLFTSGHGSRSSSETDRGDVSCFTSSSSGSLKSASSWCSTIHIIHASMLLPQAIAARLEPFSGNPISTSLATRVASGLTPSSLFLTPPICPSLPLHEDDHTIISQFLECDLSSAHCTIVWIRFFHFRLAE